MSGLHPDLHPVVAADRLLYATRFGTRHPATVGELLDAMAEAVGDAIPGGDVMVAVTRGHGFADWHAAQLSGDRPFDPLFEAAADAVVGGDEAVLAELVASRPSLVADRSPLGHAATLLHYVAANGVEFRRQQSGPNAPAIAERLLSAGATVDALADTYGGGTTQTALVLLLTSAHPAQAGVTNAVLDVLLRYGADPSGVNGDGAPLRAARRVGNDAAVDRLTSAATAGD